MTYPEDVLKAARESFATYWESIGEPGMAEATRAGKFDDDYRLHIAALAIMAERQRCAGIAKDEAAKMRELADWFDSVGASWQLGVHIHNVRSEDCERIANAILGQQETGDDRA